MTRDDAIRKIKRLKALAESNSPLKAATALRQMQALMAEFAVDDGDDIVFCDSKRAPGSKGAAPWRASLASVTAGAFHTRWLRIDSRVSHELRFFGESSACEISVYAFAVLLRQLTAARQKHLSRVRVPKNRIARGDQFALGWICSVEDLLDRPSIAARLSMRIDAKIALVHPQRSKINIDARDQKLSKLSDWVQGSLAGKNAKLHTGVAREARQEVQLELELFA